MLNHPKPSILHHANFKKLIFVVTFNDLQSNSHVRLYTHKGFANGAFVKKGIA